MTTILPVLRSHLQQLTRYFRYPVRRLTKPSIISMHGIRFPIPDESTDRDRRSLYLERHERTLALFVGAKLRSDDVVLELGGGRGVLSTICAKSIGSDRVFSVEANPALIPFIERVYELNEVRPRLIHAVAGIEKSEVPFFVSDTTHVSSMTRLSDEMREIVVKQKDVRELIAEIKPTFLISDIEGAEKDVLTVAKLDGVRVVAVELHAGITGADAVDEIDQALFAQGFQKNRWLTTSNRTLFERA